MGQRRKGFRPCVEALEDRTLLSATTTIAEERWPGNNAATTAYPLGLNWGGPNINQGARLTASDKDYYQFSTIRPPEPGDSLVLAVTNVGNFPLVLHISYWNGTQWIDASNDVGRISFAGNVTVHLDNLPSTIFLFDVQPGVGFAGTMNYTLTLDVPAILPDIYEGGAGNNTFANATFLGTATGYQYVDLTIDNQADRDFLRFYLPAQASDEHYFAIDSDYFPTTDLGLALYDDVGNLLDIDIGPTRRQQVSLANLPAGYYRVEVFGDGNQAVTNPHYRLSSWTPRAPAADSYEPNDSFAAATDLGTVQGLVQRGADRDQPNGNAFLSIHTSTDQDVYKFTTTAVGAASDFVKIAFDHTAGDLNLLLYSGGATPFLLSSSSGAGDSERISLDGLPAGTYYAKVVGVAGAINANYSLAVRGPGGAAGADQYDANFPNDNRNQATLLGPIGGLRLLSYPDYLLSIGAGDEDFFEFELLQPGASGNFVSLQFQNDLGDLDLELYNGIGSILRSSHGAGDSENLDLNGLPIGTYYLRIYGFEGATNPQYSLAINASGPDRYDEEDPNDTAATATDLRTISGQSQETGLNISSKTDQDWFKFVTTATAGGGQQIALNFENQRGNLDLFLYAADGTTILGSSRGVTNHEQIDLSNVQLTASTRGPLPAGTYLVLVKGVNGATNPLYNLTIVAPQPSGADRFDRDGNSNDDRGTAVDLRVAVDQDGTPGGLIVLGDATNPLSIQPTGDEDWFRIRITGAETFGNFASVAFDHTQGDLDLELYKDNDLTPIRSSIGVANKHSIDLSGLATSESYYLRVFGHNGATNPSYTLTVNMPEMPTGDWAEGASDNNVRARATDLGILDRPTQRTELSIHNTSDEDWFRFETLAIGAAGHSVAIAFQQLQGDLELELYDQSGTLLERSATVNDVESISFVNRPAGVYYVRVIGRTIGLTHARNPNYTLLIDPPEGPSGDYAESNDTPATAYDLRQVQGTRTFDPLSIHAAGNVDWFRFTTTSAAHDGNAITIAFDQRLGDLDLFLYDSTGTRLLGQSASADGVERVSLNSVKVGRRLGALPAGTYLIKVVGHQNDVQPRYLLTIDAPNAAAPPDFAEPNNSGLVATNLQTVDGGTTLSGLSIDKASDQDWFVFQTVGMGVDGHQVQIDFDHNDGNLTLALFAANRKTLLDASATVADREVVSLAGRPAGTYYVRVTGNRATNPLYELTLITPQTLRADYAEQPTDNDDRSRAYDLRTVAGTLALGGLSIHTAADVDWFRFDLAQATAPGQKVRIDFNHAEGNLQLALYHQGSLTPIATSNGTGDFEEIALREPNGSPLSAGAYEIRVMGSGGATNPNYAVSVSTAATVEADRYEPNDSLLTAYDFRALGQVSGSSSRAFGFGFDPFGGFGGFGGFDPFGFSGFGGFGGFDPFGFGGFGGFGGGFGGFGGIDPFTGTIAGFDLAGASAFPGFNSFGADFPGFGGFGGLGGFPGFGGFGDLSHPGFDIFGGLGGFDPFGSAGSSLFDASPGLFGNPFAGLDVPIGPGLGVGNLVGMELGFTNAFNNFAANGAINLALQIPNTPGALEAVGFGGPFLFNSLNGAIQANGGLIGNIQKNSVLTSNAIGQFSSIFRAQSNGSTISGLSVEAGDPDYFRFDLTQPGLAGQFISIAFDHNLGNLRLSLLSDQGTVLETSDGEGDVERVSLARLPAGTYYLLVEGVDGSTSNPSYSLTLSGSPANAAHGDLAESNDTAATAHDLRTVEGTQSLSDLSIHQTGDVDWFAFTLAAPTRSAISNYVRIDFEQDLGDLDLALFRAGQDQPFAVSTTTADFEQIPLMSESGLSLPIGSYFVRVIGYAGATNPNYRLTILAPEATITPDAFEPNNGLGKAVSLNDVDASALTGLTISRRDVDYYKFIVPTGHTLSLSDSVSIQFDQARGALKLALLNSVGSLLRNPTAATGNQVIALDGLTAGTYYVRVVGAGKSVANRYSLFVDAQLQENQTLNDWTVMVYMTASDLTRFAFDDINEMELAAAGLPASVNLAVLYDQSAALQTFATGAGTQPAWGTTGRAIIRPDTNPSQIATPFDLSIGEKDTGDPASLTEFVNWAKNAAPAQHYALIMWNHGQGVDGFNFDNADNATADSMTAGELNNALNAVSAFHLDLLAFDSCNMAMTELADSFSSVADVLVASEENIPGTGYDYDSFFQGLAVRPDLVSAESLASALVVNYERQYRGNTDGADTLSALRSSDMGALITALQGFTSAALAGGVTTADFDVLRDARDAASSFLGHSEQRDLGQFMQFIADATSLPSTIRNTAQGVLDALADAVIARTSDERQTSGLSILLPAHGESVSSSYTTRFASFLTATGWGNFLTQFVTGPTTRPASLNPDFAESNEQAARAYDLRSLSGHGHVVDQLSLHNRVDLDFFRFTTLATGTATDQLSITRGTSGTSWRLALLDEDGAQLTSQSGTGTSLTVSLNGRAAGMYLVRIDSTTGDLVPTYALNIDAPNAAPTSDWAGDNSTAEKAFDLGVVSSDAVFSGLVVEAGQTDWFTFATPRNVEGGATLGQLQVVSASGQTLTLSLKKDLATVTRSGDSVTIGFDTGSAFTYHVSVSGTTGDTYQLVFLPGEAPAQDLSPADDAYAVTPRRLLTVPAATGVLSNDSMIVTGETGVTAVLVTSPTKGTLTLHADGSFTYLPGAAYVGFDSFTYKLHPTSGPDSAVASVRLVPTVNFSVAAARGSEAVTTVQIVVTLSMRSSQTVTVPFEVTGLTATSGNDFNLSAGTVTFLPGQTSKVITLTIVDETSKESIEQLLITLLTPTNAVLGPRDGFTYTIVDND